MIYDNSFIPSFCKENILLDNAVWLMLYDFNWLFKDDLDPDDLDPDDMDPDSPSAMQCISKYIESCNLCRSNRWKDWLYYVICQVNRLDVAN